MAIEEESRSREGRTIAEAPAEAVAVGVGRGDGQRSAYATRDLTTGSVPGNLWFLAWPQMIEGVLNVIDQMADLFWAGRGFGFRAIAGLGVAMNYLMLIMSGRQGLDVGMQAMVARAVGMGNVRLANHAALQAFTLSGAFSLAAVLLGVLATDFLLRILGISEGVIAQTSLYMRIQFVAMAGMALRMMSGTALQAAGDTLTPMKATAITRAIHLLLGPLLAFGWLGFPAFGLAGLALANAFAQIGGVGLNFYVLFTGRSRLHLTLKGYRVDFPLLWQLIRIGAPAIVTGMERSLAQLLLVGIVARFGDIALAAFALANRAQMLVNLGMWGLGRSAGVMVGQNLGAEQPSHARQSILWALAFMFLINGVLCAVLFAFPATFLSFFNKEPELLNVAILWLRIQLVSYLLMGVGQIFSSSFQTAGDTVVPMLVTLLGMWGLEVPLAYLLPRLTGLGMFGVPWAIVIAMAAPVLIYIPYYLWGPWWKKEVLPDAPSRRGMGMGAMY